MKRSIQIICLSLLSLAVSSLYSKSCCFDDIAFTMNNCLGSCQDCHCQVTNKTFLSVRPFFEAACPAKRALVLQEQQQLRVNNGSLFQVVPFGGKTLRPEYIAEYFGPSCKRILNVTEEPTETTDVLSAQLGIVTTDGDFSSQFCLSPVQTFAGVGLNYRTHFCCKPNENKGFFVDLTMPVYYVKNLVNLQEKIINNGGGAADVGYVDSVKAAFQQSSWRFARIDDCNDTTEVGISEFDIQVGYGWGEQQAYMHSYLGVIIPTGNKVNAIKVFQPIIGWNHNVAVHFGGSFGIELWQSRCERYSIWYELATDSRYFFENTQCRTFNVKNKPWSRYMQVYSNLAQAREANAAASPADVQIGTPGVNIFTQKVKVRPRYQRTYNTAFVFGLVKWTLEVGYNFFTRDEECVKLACPWDQLVGITYQKDGSGNLVPVDGPALKSLQGLGFTDNVQQIGNDYSLANAQPLANYASNIITADQLDLKSAQAPCLLSQRFYSAVGYTINCRFTTVLGLGGEYEFAGDNSGINRWGVWAKAAVIY